MIKVKSLIKEIHDTGTILPRDVYNLYYLEFVSSRYPALVQTPYGKEILSYYLSKLKEKYLNLFKTLLFKQIDKYFRRNRIDPDFDKSRLSPEASAKDLKDLMAKTFRSDMKRRNDVWNAVAGYVYGLEHATSPNDIFVNINGLNNSVHNTQGKILFDWTKVPNANELMQAFSVADGIKNGAQWELMKGKVDKDVRDLLNQDDTIMEGVEIDSNSNSFKTGVKMGLRDKQRGEFMKLRGMPPDFIAGYNSVNKSSLWDKANNKLTQFLGNMGYGNSRKL